MRNLEKPTLVRMKGDHGDEISQASFSPDGRLLATSGYDGRIRLWDTSSSAPKATSRLAGPSTRGWATISTTGRRAATSDGEGSVTIWDTVSESVVRKLKGDRSFAFSNSDTMFTAAAKGSPLKIWSVETGEEMCEVGEAGKSHSTVKFSPDDQVLATVIRSKLHLWDAETGKMLAAPPIGRRPSWSVFSPDSRLLLGFKEREVIALWDSRSGEEIRTFETKTADVFSDLLSYGATGPGCLTFTPDGRTVLWGRADGTVVFYDSRTGGVQRILRAHEKGLARIQFSANGKRMLMSGSNEEATIWETSSHALLARLRVASSSANHFLLWPDGKRAACLWGWAPKGGLRIFDAEGGKELLSMSYRSVSPLGRAVVRDDGSLLVSCNENVVLVQPALNWRKSVTELENDRRNAWRQRFRSSPKPRESD
jgi:WD40 repeat protein